MLGLPVCSHLRHIMVNEERRLVCQVLNIVNELIINDVIIIPHYYNSCSF